MATKNELVKWFAGIPGIKASLKRQELLKKLIAEDPDLPTVDFDIYEPMHAEIVVRLKFLFFGNLYQDLTEFVLQDLGLTRFECYPLTRENRLFSSRAAFEYGMRLSELSLRSVEAEYAKDSAALMALADSIPEQPSHPVLFRKYCRLVNRIAREQERAERYDDALVNFQKSTLPPSRERQARILERQGLIEESLAICTTIIEQPVSDMEHDFALRFSKKLSGEKISRKKQLFNEQHLRLERTGEGVEWQVKEYFQGQGWQAFYVENQLINSMAGLYFWEAMFADIFWCLLSPLSKCTC